MGNDQYFDMGTKIVALILARDKIRLLVLVIGLFLVYKRYKCSEADRGGEHRKGRDKEQRLDDMIVNEMKLNLITFYY